MQNCKNRWLNFFKLSRFWCLQFLTTHMITSLSSIYSRTPIIRIIEAKGGSDNQKAIPVLLRTARKETLTPIAS